MHMLILRLVRRDVLDKQIENNELHSDMFYWTRYASSVCAVYLLVIRDLAEHLYCIDMQHIYIN